MRRIAFMSFFVACALPGQPNTWVVGSGGFATLQAAFDSPQVLPGDIVIVRAGTYGTSTLRKGLVVRGELGAIIDEGGNFFGAPLTVSNVPAAQLAVISGFRLNQGKIVVTDCLGPVVIESITAAQSGNINFPNWPIALETQRSRWVFVTGFTGSGRVARFTDSNVTLEMSNLVSLNGSGGIGGSYGGGPAVGADRCSMSIAYSSLAGANISGGSNVCGSAALYVTDCFVGVTNCTLVGGTAPSSAGCGTPGIVFTGRGALVIDPAVTIRPGTTGAPPVIGITPTYRVVPSLTANAFQIGSPVSGVISGQPGDQFAVVLGTAAQPVFVQALDGGLGVDLAAPLVVVAAGIVSGTTTWRLTVPNLPALVGQAVGMQGYVGASHMALSNPVIRTIR